MKSSHPARSTFSVSSSSSPSKGTDFTRHFAMVLGLFVALLAFGACASVSQADEMASSGESSSGDKSSGPDRSLEKKDWDKSLTSEQRQVLREGGTERAFTGEYWNEKEEGVYRCAGCGAELFSSETKYDSGSGWPSFYQPIAKGRVKRIEDGTLGMKRVEIRCARCDGHLGHVFPDGPEITGERFCVNSASMSFDTGAEGSPAVLENTEAAGVEPEGASKP